MVKKGEIIKHTVSNKCKELIFLDVLPQIFNFWPFYGHLVDQSDPIWLRNKPRNSILSSNIVKISYSNVTIKLIVILIVQKDNDTFTCLYIYIYISHKIQGLIHVALSSERSSGSSGRIYLVKSQPFNYCQHGLVTPY